MFRSSKVPFGSPGSETLPSRPAPLLSPPETELEPGPSAPAHEPYASSETHANLLENPAQRFRRLAYNTGSLNRDSRTSQRQSKWLIMVVPPASLTHEPPSLGHTLSSGPIGRFSNGILMPLFPTLYAQLTAIAREFNMPSTTGLCVYLHLQESGVPIVTPRISDETWQILWGHYFGQDDRPPTYTSHGLPIAGRIEFDVDLRRAKWFSTWMGTGFRDRADSELEPSVAPSHWRGESRTSFLFPGDQTGEESPSPPEVTPTANVPLRAVSQRQGPRPLLLEKREVIPLRPFSKHPSRGQNMSMESQSLPVPAVPPENTFVPNTLSPMVQELEEPQTAKKPDLDSIVRQWRSSSVTGVPTNGAVAAGQPSLDPVNMPPGADIELDLDDFAWSISSAGPPLDSPSSPNWPSPLPSIHVVERAFGSVCLTPTTCTTWGPPSCPGSPLSYTSRRPSVDLGRRMVEDVPLTPSTATTWGPEDLPSPAFSLYRAPSVDIGRRNMGSVPPTPSTATTWGPADSPLIIPESPIHVRTPDAAERTFPDGEVRSGHYHQMATSVLGFLHYDARSIEPWRHVWPYQNRDLSPGRARIRGACGQTFPSREVRSGSAVMSTLGFPYYNASTIGPWSHVWPYQANGPQTRARDAGEQALDHEVGSDDMVISTLGFPYHDVRMSGPWRHVWPYQDEGFLFTNARTRDTSERPSPDREVRSEVISMSGFPYYNASTSGPWRHVWPYQGESFPLTHIRANERAFANREGGSEHMTNSKLGFPYYTAWTIGPWRHVWPYQTKSLFKDTKGGVQDQVTTSTATPNLGLPINVNLSSGYPTFQIYLAVYPHNLTSIYPSLRENLEANYRDVQVSLRKQYPFFGIYPALYPYNMDAIYPSQEVLSSKGNVEDQPLPEYPDFSSLFPTDPAVKRAGMVKVQPVVLYSTVYEYPYFMIYPAVYPYNVLAGEIYPQQVSSTNRRIEIPRKAHFSERSYSQANGAMTHKSLPATLPQVYPILRIYQLVYPFSLSEIYPSSKEEKIIWNKFSLDVSLPIRYPRLVIYPSVYPYSVYEIYESMPELFDQSLSSAVTKTKTIRPKSIIGFECAPSSSKELPVTLGSQYPFIQPYEPVYPWLVVYPPIAISNEAVPSQHFAPLVYPTMQIYKPIYPHLEIYPPIQLCMSKNVDLSTELKAAYPALEIYQSVYPHFVIYPEVSAPSSNHKRSSCRKRAPTPGPDRQLLPPTFVTADSKTEGRLSRSTVKRPLVPPLPSMHCISNPSFGSTSPSERLKGEEVQPYRRPKKTHWDLHLMVFAEQSDADSAAVNASMPDSQSKLPRIPRKTHHELHLMVFGADEESTINVVSPTAFSPVPPAPAQRRSRSGTVTQRGYGANIRPTMIIPEQPTARPPSPLFATDSPSSKGSSPTNIRSTTVLSNTPPISMGFPRARGLPSSPSQNKNSVVGLPSSPAQTRLSTVGLPSSPSSLMRARSMTRERTPLATGLSEGADGLDRSRSMTEASRLSRRSTIQDRARLFARDLDASNSEQKVQTSTRPAVHRLDRSKIPFS